MNRRLWGRILMVAVVAPYLYGQSKRAESDYFKIGLKLAAGYVVFDNLQPLLVQAAPLIRELADATARASKSKIIDRENAIDVEFVEETDEVKTA